ncbi:MAG: SHOCT domain-containing protein [Dethiosulfatibacter sp.]|nr:SHOCT domain-containing protein [Dethiosulfatibacter sp.]
MIGNGYGSCHFGGWNGFSGWYYLIMIGIAIIVVAIILMAIRKNNGDEYKSFNTLKELFVKGEITEEEYLKRKSIIEKK